jgi:hypothetical protein
MFATVLCFEATELLGMVAECMLADSGRDLVTLRSVLPFHSESQISSAVPFRISFRAVDPHFPASLPPPAVGDVEISDCSSGADGGGVYAYSPMSFLSTKDRSTTSFISNRAQRSGGGLWIATSTIEVAFNHRLSFRANEAGANGGGLAITDGAQIVLVDEECPSRVCSPASRGNGVCEVDCMTRACNWSVQIEVAVY